MGLKAFHTEGKIEVACDEAGRGCLAGPVYAAAVILSPKKLHPLLNDSKKLTANKRQELKIWIEENALDFAVGIVDQEEIDEINILNASFLAMHRAIDQIRLPFDQLLIDGNRFKKYNDKKHHCLVKGDARFMSIAAASILAKFHRDEYMMSIAKLHPEYLWEKNFGYPTRAHRQAIKEHGITKYHRKSFRLLNPQLELYS